VLPQFQISNAIARSRWAPRLGLKGSRDSWPHSRSSWAPPSSPRSGAAPRRSFASSRSPGPRTRPRRSNPSRFGSAHRQAMAAIDGISLDEQRHGRPRPCSPIAQPRAESTSPELPGGAIEKAAEHRSAHARSAHPLVQWSSHQARAPDVDDRHRLLARLAVMRRIGGRHHRHAPLRRDQRLQTRRRRSARPALRLDAHSPGLRQRLRRPPCSIAAAPSRAIASTSSSPPMSRPASGERKSCSSPSGPTPTASPPRIPARCGRDGLGCPSIGIGRNPIPASNLPTRPYVRRLRRRRPSGMCSIRRKQRPHRTSGDRPERHMLAPVRRGIPRQVLFPKLAFSRLERRAFMPIGCRPQPAARAAIVVAPALHLVGDVVGQLVVGGGAGAGRVLEDERSSCKRGRAQQRSRFVASKSSSVSVGKPTMKSPEIISGRPSRAGPGTPRARSRNSRYSRPCTRGSSA
jgi:hypothetical protein